MSDIVKKLVMDIADWVLPISEAKDHLAGLAGATDQGVSKIKSSFASLGAAKSSIADIGNQWNNFLSNQRGVEDYTGASLYLFSTIRQSAKSLGSARDSIRDVSGQWTVGSTAVKQLAKDSSGTATATRELTQAAASQNGVMAGLAQTILGRLPAAYVAYRLAGDDVIAGMQRHLSVNSEMMTSIRGMIGGASNFANTLSGEVLGGIRASAESLLQFTTGFSGLPELIDSSAGVITRWSRSATDALNYASGSAREAGLVFGTALAIWHGADSNQAAAFYEEGQALNQLAQETANVIAKQEQQRSVLQTIIAASERAAAAQKTSAEVSRIGTISSVEALDAELVALKQRSANVDANTQKSKEWQAEIAAITGAIEKQRAAIQNGTFKPKEDPVQKMIDDAKRQLDSQKNPIQSQIDIAVAGGANAEQVNELRRLLEAKRDLTEQERMQAEAERESNRVAEESQRMFESGTSKINSLQDQIDKLTGAATDGEIAMRELARQGYDQDQIAKVGQLTDELKRLQEEKKDSSSKSSSGGKDNEAALQGSKKAAELVLRGVGGTGGNNPVVDEQKKANEHLKKLVEAAHNTKGGGQVQVIQ